MKKLIICFLSIAMFFNIFMIDVNASMNTQDKTLIRSVSNSEDGVLKVRVKIPAHDSVTINMYPNKLAAGTQYGEMIDKHYFTISNSSNKAIIKTKMVNVNYYGKYIINASRKLNPYAWDKHTCISKLFKSKKVLTHTWTESEVKEYNRGKWLELS